MLVLECRRWRLISEWARAAPTGDKRRWHSPHHPLGRGAGEGGRLLLLGAAQGAKFHVSQRVWRALQGGWGVRRSFAVLRVVLPLIVWRIAVLIREKVKEAEETDAIVFYCALFFTLKLPLEALPPPSSIPDLSSPLPLLLPPGYGEEKKTMKGYCGQTAMSFIFYNFKNTSS